MPRILMLGSLRWQNYDFKASLDDTIRLCLTKKKERDTERKRQIQREREIERGRERGERDTKREKMYVCDRERKNECVREKQIKKMCVCVTEYVKEKQRENVCVREKESEYVCVHEREGGRRREGEKEGRRDRQGWHPDFGRKLLASSVMKNFPDFEKASRQH